MRKFTWLLALAIPVTIISCQKDAVQAPANEDEPLVQGAGLNGNGAPSGEHYTLNILGVKAGHEKSVDFTGGNGHRIFVPLGRTGEIARCKILLTKGDFDVTDANGTDGTAGFSLPEPDADNDGWTDYSVFVRALGNKGSATMTSCFYDKNNSSVDGTDGTPDEYCSTGNYVVHLDATKGGEKFQNVSNQLLYVWADVDGDGDIDRTELFSDPLDEYYWYYDNQGLKHAQMRFYKHYETEVWPDPETL